LFRIGSIGASADIAGSGPAAAAAPAAPGGQSQEHDSRGQKGEKFLFHDLLSSLLLFLLICGSRLKMEKKKFSLRSFDLSPPGGAGHTESAS
jgi:hypothetical protein